MYICDINRRIVGVGAEIETDFGVLVGGKLLRDARSRSRCLVFGDNLRGDIISGMSIGARGMWMPSPWSVYREGTVPDGVVQIEKLEDFWDGISRLQ